MRRSVIVLSIVLILGTASAAWAAFTNVQVLPGSVTAIVTNNSPYVIICSGSVIGITDKGAPLYAWMSQVMIPPWASQAVYVAADLRFNYFVRGWSEIACI